MDDGKRPTPEEHRAKAEAALDAMQMYQPGAEEYHGLVMSAIAHVLVAVASYLEPPALPEIPGLPDGWRLELEQAKGGSRKWAYMLTAPDGTVASTQHRWDTPQYALAAGVKVAARAAEEHSPAEHEIQRAMDAAIDELSTYDVLLHTWWRL